MTYVAIVWEPYLTIEAEHQVLHPPAHENGDNGEKVRNIITISKRPHPIVLTARDDKEAIERIRAKFIQRVPVVELAFRINHDLKEEDPIEYYEIKFIPLNDKAPAIVDLFSFVLDRNPDSIFV